MSVSRSYVVSVGLVDKFGGHMSRSVSVLGKSSRRAKLAARWRVRRASGGRVVGAMVDYVGCVVDDARQRAARAALVYGVAA